MAIFGDRYLDSDRIISKLLYSWLFIDPSENHYTTQTSKFNNLLNQVSTVLNNVFNALSRAFQLADHRNVN